MKSETGLDILRDHGIRFYVLTTDYDLFDPQQRFFLSTFTNMNAFHAACQSQKSLLNRIERAKRGIPTCGKLPFGRIWDGATWTIDKEKQKIIIDIAERYLAGKKLLKLASEYDMNHMNLTKILRDRCGDKWDIDFAAKKLNINQTVTL